MTLEQYVVPEMLRTRLEEVVLQIKILELGRASSFLSRVLEPPSEDSVRQGSVTYDVQNGGGSGLSKKNA